MKKILIPFWLGTISVVYLLWFFMSSNFDAKFDEVYESALIMKEVIAVITEKRLKEINPLFDPNMTGLIGEELTELTTTAGDLASKRTTTNPDIAALICYLLTKVGVKKGDCVAIGASGSFPGLIVATISACKSIGAKPLIICSIGSSQWGANSVNFTTLDLFHWLVEMDFEAPLLFTYGGADNTGNEFTQEIKNRLIQKARDYGFTIYEGVSLDNDVHFLYKLYMDNCVSRISAFINIGGSLVNVGRSFRISLETGIVRDKRMFDKRSIMGLMAENDVPIINLLNMRKLTMRYNLPWDPIPLPEVTKERYRNLLKKFVKSR